MIENYGDLRRKIDSRNRDYFLRKLAERILDRYMQEGLSPQTFWKATRLLPVDKDLTREQLMNMHSKLSLFLNSDDAGETR